MYFSYYLNQKKTLEVNPRHPLIKELLRRVNDNPDDAKAKEIAVMMFRTATLRYDLLFLHFKYKNARTLYLNYNYRSGYMLQETADFADNVEKMMRQSLGISIDAQPDEEDFSMGSDDSTEKDQQQEDEIDAEEHDEL